MRLSLSKADAQLNSLFTSKLPVKFIKQTPFSLKGVKNIKAWILSICESESKFLDQIHYNFLSDNQLLKINQQYLNHDTYTDIITFDYCEENNISGEIYISIDRVKENAQQNKQSFHDELLRVLAHGVLHLCGYKDKNTTDQKLMRQKEDFYIEMFHVKHS